ncbi:MAG: SRPBCC family protein [Nocardioidaceae bacterium]
MPVVSAEVVVEVAPAVAFAVSQTTGETRLHWDPFIRHQHLMDGAERPAKGVRTFTRSRHGFAMVSRYVSYVPGSNVGMTMESGPWFFDVFGGGWRFTAYDGGTKAVWKYNFSVRPAWLRPVAHPLGTWLLGRDIRRRIRAFALACSDPVVLAAVAQPLDS